MYYYQFCGYICGACLNSNSTKKVLALWFSGNLTNCWCALKTFLLPNCDSWKKCGDIYLSVHKKKNTPNNQIYTLRVRISPKAIFFPQRNCLLWSLSCSNAFKQLRSSSASLAMADWNWERVCLCGCVEGVKPWGNPRPPRCTPALRWPQRHSAHLVPVKKSQLGTEPFCGK